MKAVGLDLAGSPKNPTGFCVLSEEDGVKTVETKLLYSDEEILQEADAVKPDIIAVDAPLTYAGKKRLCDVELKSYGALPPTLPGMEVLARRGTALAEKLKAYRVIEVYATASAKILGIYHKDDFTCQKKLLSLNLSGDLNQRLLSRDELDAVFAAITGLLYLINQTKSVGNADGTIIIPDV